MHGQGALNPVCTFVLLILGYYNKGRLEKIGGEEEMSDAFRFETFVDAHSNIFNEYLGSVVAKLSRENEEYRAVRAEIESLYGKYPKVLSVFDTETAAELTEEECAALIKVMELRNKLTDMEMQSVYFRGCYDSVGYLKKAGIL